MTLYIVVPVYNAEKYINDAIKSLKIPPDIKRFKTRIVLVNDGSTDQSAEICFQYQVLDETVQFLSQENQGVSVARNAGLNYIYENCSDDDFVGFCDADDLWVTDWPQIIERQIRKNSGADIIGFGETDLDDTGKVIQSIYPTAKICDGGYASSVTENRCMSFASYIYKAGLLRSNHILFPPGVTNGEDLVFKYEVFLLASQIAYSGEKLYIYRRNSDQVTSNYSRDAKEHYGVLLKGWEALEKFSKKEFLNHQEDTRKLGEYAQRNIMVPLSRPLSQILS